MATLCLDHRLSIYTTNKIDKDWKEISCISDKWHNQCKTLLGSDPKFNKLKKRKGCPKSKIPVGELITKSELEMVYINAVVLTCLDWCPVLVTSQNQKYALLTAVTKSGTITFWKCCVPCSAGDTANVQLIDSDIQTGVSLPCSVAWYSRDGSEGEEIELCSVFFFTFHNIYNIVCIASGLLAIGGCDGQIEVLALKISQNSESNLTINIPSKHMLWNDCDDLAVNSLQWIYTSKVRSDFFHWLVPVLP